MKPIAIDIDEVTADFISYFIYFHNLMYKTQMSRDKMEDYYLHEAFDVEKEEMWIRFAEFRAFHLLERVVPVKGAIEGIKRLIKMGYKPHFVTARPQEIEKETKAWFKIHFKEKNFPIYFTHSSSGIRPQKKKKSQICKEIGAKILIDDHLSNALDCAENGILVYMLDTPWNKRDSLPSNIIRVKSWKEILKKIK